MTDTQQRNQLDLLARLNKHALQHNEADAALAARIQLRTGVPNADGSLREALDYDKELQVTKSLVRFAKDKRCAHFGKQCLMARRLVERGVRFVQIYSGGEENERSWDGHSNIAANHRQFAGETDIPIGGLLTDLKQRAACST